METAFLQAVVENPDDLAVRLIFADWLGERVNAVPPAPEVAGAPDCR